MPRALRAVLRQFTGCAVRVHTVAQIRVRHETLVRRVIPTLISCLIEQSISVQATPQLLARAHVVLVRRADEAPVVRQPELLEAAPEVLRDAVAPLTRLHAVLFRRRLDLQPVLVTSRQHKRRAPAVARIQQRHIRQRRRVDVPDVRAPVHVVDRRCHVELLLFLSHETE